jgi:hypothetical protein
MLTIEFEPPIDTGPCSCCGGTTTQLTRFVRSDGDAYAVYLARYSDNHPDRSAVLTVSLGAFGAGTTADQRAAFVFVLRVMDGALCLRMADAAEAPWGQGTVLGRVLDRAAAEPHPLRGAALDVVDQALLQDAPLRAYLFSD